MVNLALSSLAGGLLTLSIEPVGQWWAAPIAIALHMFVLERSDHKILSVFLFATVFNSISLHWSSTFVGSIPWLLLSLGLSLFYLPLALVSRVGISFYPLIFIALEEVRNRTPFGGFGWLRLAYSQAEAPYSKIAAIGGASALSAAVLLIAYLLYALIRIRVAWLALIPFLVLLLPINVQNTGSAKVLLIQGNVPELGLDFNSRAKAVFFNHIEQTRLSLSKTSDVDFILWPENSVDVDPFQNSDVSDALNAITKPIIIGAIVGKGEKLLNTSILWGGELPPIYIKQHLTPFGEYIPLRSIASLISPLTDRVTDFEPGKAQIFFTVGDSVIAPVICYELIDDEIMHQASKGSNILAVQTNSATFGMSAQSAQQLAITRVRAIEHGRTVLSASTTGYSAIIDYKGQILDTTTMATAASIASEVALFEGLTPRDQLGDWALVLVLLVLLLIAAKENERR